jgi:hypothetical protein
MIPSYDLLTIGHSNLAADRFMALLKSARVSAIADVRSVPFSRWCPWFSSKALAQRLAEEGIVYIPLGDALGGAARVIQAFIAMGSPTTRPWPHGRNLRPASRKSWMRARATASASCVPSAIRSTATAAC